MLAPHALGIAVIVSSLIASLRFTFVDILKTFIVKLSYALVSGITNKSLRPKEAGGSGKLVSSAVPRSSAIVTSRPSKRGNAKNFRKWRRSECKIKLVQTVFLLFPASNGALLRSTHVAVLVLSLEVSGY